MTAGPDPFRAGPSCVAGASTARSRADQPTYDAGPSRVDGARERATVSCPNPSIRVVRPGSTAVLSRGETLSAAKAAESSGEYSRPQA